MQVQPFFSSEKSQGVDRDLLIHKVNYEPKNVGDLSEIEDPNGRDRLMDFH